MFVLKSCNSPEAFLIFILWLFYERVCTEASTRSLTLKHLPCPLTFPKSSPQYSQVCPLPTRLCCVIQAIKTLHRVFPSPREFPNAPHNSRLIRAVHSSKSSTGGRGWQKTISCELVGIPAHRNWAASPWI